MRPVHYVVDCINLKLKVLLVLNKFNSIWVRCNVAQLLSNDNKYRWSYGSLLLLIVLTNVPRAPCQRSSCFTGVMMHLGWNSYGGGRGGGGLPRRRRRVHRRGQPVQLGIFSPGKWRRYYQADKVHVQHPSWFHTRSRAVFIRECAELLEKLSEDVRPAKKKKLGAHIPI